MQIKKATVSDLNEIARLLRLCVGDSADREAKEYLENTDVLTLVAKDNEVLGFISLLITLDTADILDIAVDERHRNRGIAKALLNNALDMCNIKTITLEVRESNTTARLFYEKNNFKQISIRKNYYTAPKEDAVIYQREL